MDTATQTSWTAESVEALIRLARKGETATDIAMTLDRPETAVRTKAEEIGVVLAHFPQGPDAGVR